MNKIYIYIGIGIVLILIIGYMLYFTKDSSRNSLIASSVNLSKDVNDLHFNKTHKPESAIYSYSMNVLVEGVINNIDTDYIKKYYLFYRNDDNGFVESGWNVDNHGKNIGLRLDSNLTTLYLDYMDTSPSQKTATIITNFPIGKWTNVIINVDNSNINVYIDSKLVKSINGSIKPPSVDSPIKFSHFKAHLADFRYYMSIINPEHSFFGLDK